MIHARMKTYTHGGSFYYVIVVAIVSFIFLEPTLTKHFLQILQKAKRTKISYFLPLLCC